MRPLLQGEQIVLCVVDKWGEIVEFIDESPSECELCAEKEVGFNLDTQNIKLEGRVVARVAVQYAEGCFTARAVENALERAAVYLGRYLAESLNRDQENGGN